MISSTPSSTATASVGAPPSSNQNPTALSLTQAILPPALPQVIDSDMPSIQFPAAPTPLHPTVAKVATKAIRQMPALIPDIDDEEPTAPRSTAHVVQSQKVDAFSGEDHVDEPRDVEQALPMQNEIELEQAMLLANETWIHIFSYLNAKQLANSELICKHFQQLCSDDILWKPLFLSAFPSITLSNNKSFKQTYKLLSQPLPNVTNGRYTLQTIQMPKQAGWMGGMTMSSLTFAEGKLFSGSWEGTIKVWDPLTRKCLSSFEGDPAMKAINTLIFAEGILFSGSGTTIKMWDPRTEKCLRIFTGHTGTVNALAFAGEILFSGSNDNTIKVWNTQTGECLKTFTGHKDSVTSLIAAEGMFFSSSFDGTVKMWDLQTGDCLRTFKGHAHRVPVTDLAFGEGILFSSYNDGTIKMWNPQTADCLYTFFERCPTSTVSALTFAEGKLFCSQNDNVIRVLDPKTHQYLHYLGGHEDNISDIKFAEGMLFSCSTDNTIKIWNFNATTDAVFKNIADQFFNKTDHTTQLRFFCMPEQEKNGVYYALYNILNPPPHLDNFEYGKHAFLDMYGSSCSGPIKAKAIHHHLARKVAKLFEEGTALQELALQKFNELLPEDIKNQIYYEMYLLLQPFPYESPTAGADAFQGNPQAGKVATGQERAQAIYNYLSKRS